MSSDGVVADSFPSIALLPKKEITALSFINRYPEYDGRGVIVAIFDTGVDPGAPGMQVTTDGKPKIVDIISATNDHAVDTSTVVTIDEGTNTITSLTGRKLKIPNSWSNPTGKWHIGLKHAYELYPSDVCSRIKKEYQSNNFLPNLRDVKASTIRDLQEFESKEKSEKSKAPSSPKDSAESTTASGDEAAQEPIIIIDKTFESQLQKEDLQAKVDATNSLEENYNDLGPTYDCVVFHDGKMWRACVDVTKTGDLEKCDLLGPFKETFKYGVLNERDQLNYSINVYDEGNVLEINCITSNHGTHVAAITAANFPDEPEKNGIAPGAQIISINIGNARLGGGMETGTSIIKACLRAIEAKADLINMSFGEPIAWSGGRTHDFMNEVVEKHGIIFITAAGNSGPSLSTVGASSLPASVMGVGAYVSPEMMEAEYSTREKIPGRILTFSSKDPNIEGGISTVVCAPGAAIASISRTSLTKCALYNGTSMAAPNAAGGVALLLSGLKQKNLLYSPFSVRRAFENTALKPPTYDPFAMGNGLMQVDAAFEHAIKFNDSIERDVRFKINCGNGKQGIYLREEADFIRPTIHTISIEPSWVDHDNYDNVAKGDFEMKLCLTCNASWVQIPSFLLLTNTTRNINIKVDPSGLAPGEHFTQLRAYDSTKPDKGFIFQIPITVLKPTELDAQRSIPWRTIELKPGVSHYTHIIPPIGSTVAIFKVKNIGSVATGTCMINMRQLIPQAWGRNLKRDISVNPGAAIGVYFPIWDHRSVSFTLTKWWSSLGDATLSYTIEFGGANLDTSEVTMFASKGFHKLQLVGSSPHDFLQPKVSLTHSVVPLKPVDDIISPLTSRDIMPGGRQIYELMLTYNFNLPKAAEATCMLPVMDTLLYENEYDSHVWQIFNSNKQFMMAGEAVTERNLHRFERYSKKLEKGDYTVKLQIRHDNPSFLKKLNKVPIHLVSKLPSAASLDIYATQRELLLEGKPFGIRQISEKQQINFYIKAFNSEKVPKNIPTAPGSFLCGTLCLSKEESRKKSEEYSFFYILDGEAAKKVTNGKDSDEKTIEEQYHEALIDFKALWISKLQANHDTLLADIGELKPDKKHALILAQIQSLNLVKDESARQYDKIIELADEIISVQNTDDFYGSLLFAKNRAKMFNDEHNKKDENLKTLEKQKDRLCEALNYKGLAILHILKASDQTSESTLIPSSTNDSQAQQSTETTVKIKSKHKYSLRQVDEIVCDLKKLDEINNVKWHKLVYQHAIVKGQYGRALKAVQKQLESKQTKELYEQLIDSYNRLGWTFAAEHVKRSIHVAFPPAYRPF